MCTRTFWIMQFSLFRTDNILTALELDFWSIHIGCVYNPIIVHPTTKVWFNLSTTWLVWQFDRQDKSKIKEVPKKISQTVARVNPLIALSVKCFGREFWLAGVWGGLFLLKWQLTRENIELVKLPPGRMICGNAARVTPSILSQPIIYSRFLQ